jgi:large subunit ribosomal protein L5
LNKYVPRLKLKYEQEIREAMQKKFGYKNVNQIPRIKKIVVNMGVGEASRDIKELDAAEKELALISGQKARTTRAKVSVAQFKIRQGMPVGCFVTLRGPRMYEFLDRLIHVALPRIRDFRGLPGQGVRRSRQPLARDQGTLDLRRARL